MKRLRRCLLPCIFLDSSAFTTICRREPDPYSHHHRHLCAQRRRSAEHQQGETVKRKVVVFKSGGNITPHVVNSCLEACTSEIMAISLLLWFGRQPGYFHERQAYEIVIPIIKRLLEQFGTVDRLVRELERNGCVLKAQTFLVFLRVFWQGDMFELAVETFQEMLKYGFVPNTFALNVMIDILFIIGRKRDALAILFKCESPNYLSFDIATKNLCKLGDYKSVGRLVKVMLEAGFSLNFDTYMMVVNCLCKSKRLMCSLPVIGLMIVSGHGFCRAVSVDASLQMSKNSEKCGFLPSLFTYTSLIKAFLEVQMFNEALSVWRDMESKGCVPDLVLYNVLIHGLCKLGRYKDALKFLAQLIHSGLQPDSYTLCSLWPITSYTKDPFSLFELLKGAKISLDLVCCNSLMNAFNKTGYASRALKVYDYMLEKGVKPDNFSYTALLTGLCSLGRLTFAIDVYCGLLNSNVRIDAYVHTAIFHGLVKCGKVHESISLYRKAVTKNYLLDEISHAVVLHGLIKADRIYEAHNFFSHMVEIGLIPNTCTCNMMLYGLCRDRDVLAVKNFVKQMFSAGIKLDSISFNILLGFLCESGCIASAFHLFDKMSEHSVDPTRATYAILIDGLHKVGKLDDAYRMLIDYVDGIGSNASDILPLKSNVLESILKFNNTAIFEHPLDSFEACRS